MNNDTGDEKSTDIDIKRGSIKWQRSTVSHLTTQGIAQLSKHGTQKGTLTMYKIQTV